MKFARPLAALLLSAAAPLAAHAHNFWMLPSATVLSHADSWITVDAAVSNDLFYFNHVPLAVDALVITGPDGATVPAQNTHKGKYRTTFDVQLARPGTYRLAIARDSVVASYTLNGETRRWRGTAKDFAGAIPAEARDVKVAQTSSRLETFVTAGKPTTDNLKASGSGLELEPITHFNDLYAGEPARFRLLAEGKPAADVAVTIVRGGTRYRDQLHEIKATTDANGEFSVTWPEPGMYWLDADAEDDHVTVPQAGKRRLAYTATFEVLPQ